MALPTFATLEELDARIPGGIDQSDMDRALAALDDVSDLIRAEAGKDWVDDQGELVDDVPGVLRVIAITAARRELANPDGVISESIDGFSHRLANASTGVYLTPVEAKRVRRASGRSGVWSLGTTRGLVETHGDSGLGDDVYLDVVGSEPIPFLPG